MSEIADLTAQHEAIINATGPLRKAAAVQDHASINTHVASLVALLEPHTFQEELGVFTELRKRAEFTEHVKTLCEEHEYLHDLFARILDGEIDLTDEAISALREHIEKEENGVFPAAAVELEGSIWQELADRSGATKRTTQSEVELPDL